jgi:uncharacterized protein YebE (UPF0316 family)
MEILFNVNAWLAAGLIFLMRVSDMTLDTLRVLVVMRGKKAIAWMLGFFQSSIFVLALSTVLSNLDNPLNMVGYAAGFATGNVVGMWIEERLAIGHLHLRIISSRRGAAIAEALRAEGYAVTEIPARGKDGTVSLLAISVLRKNAGKIQELIRSIDGEAFITAEDVRPLRRGFWRS